jgi:uncharacterized membrane protein YvbJ
MYCHNCGEQLPEKAAYCPKCGTRTNPGAQGSGTASEEMRESFTRMSQEMERAFTIAAKELQEAFKTARNNIQRTVYKEPIICPSCGEKNLSSASYCVKCGKSLYGTQSSTPSNETQGSPQ